MLDTPIPVICDRCRAEGVAGDDPFEAFGALLDFDPVPRLKTRPDGWDAECQRAFIAALSLTGSVRAAARAVSKSTFGADQLRRAEGNESFLAAWEDAMAMAADERSRRLAEGLRSVAAEQTGWRPPAPPWSNAAARRGRPPTAALSIPQAEPEPEDPERRVERDRAFLVRLLGWYLQRLDMEREARLEGRIAAADLYVRQVTCVEVILDLCAADMGEDAVRLIADKSRDGLHLVQIAETPMSRLLDEARAAHWKKQGEPQRPPAPRHLIEDRGRFGTEPGPHARSDHELSLAEQDRWWKDQIARDAAAIVEWEARARAEAAAWRARREAEAEAAEAKRAGVQTPPCLDEETAKAGQPAPGPDPGDRTDVTSGKGRDTPHLADRSGGAIDLATVRDVPSDSPEPAEPPSHDHSGEDQ